MANTSGCLLSGNSNLTRTYSNLGVRAWRSLCARYGHRTWAMLDKCFVCSKPYEEAYPWHTYRTDNGKNHTVSIMCHKCHESLGKEDSDAVQ